MKIKTRKLIWSVPLMATLAVVGALAVFVALGLPNANPAEAQDGGFTTNPTPTTGVTPVAGNGTLTVTWTMPTTGSGTPTYDAFSVQYHMVAAGGSSPAIDSTGWMEADGTMALGRGDLSHQITGLTNGSNYYVRVALARSGGGDPGDDTYGVSAASEAPAAGAPLAPTVTLVQTGDDTITARWTPSSDDGGSDITGYFAQIQRVAQDLNSDADSTDGGEGAITWQPTATAVTAVPPDYTGTTQAPNEGTPSDLVAAVLSDTERTWSGLYQGAKYEVRVYTLNSAQEVAAAAGITDTEIGAFKNAGMGSIEIAEAANISLGDL